MARRLPLIFKFYVEFAFLTSEYQFKRTGLAYTPNQPIQTILDLLWHGIGCAGIRSTSAEPALDPSPSLGCPQGFTRPSCLETKQVPRDPIQFMVPTLVMPRVNPSRLPEEMDVFRGD